jgi:hypothetical protein
VKRAARRGASRMMLELATQGYTAPLALIPSPVPAPMLGLPDDVPFSSLDSGQRQLRINTWISSLFNHAEGAPPAPHAVVGPAVESASREDVEKGLVPCS